MDLWVSDDNLSLPFLFFFFQVFLTIFPAICTISGSCNHHHHLTHWRRSIHFWEFNTINSAGGNVINTLQIPPHQVSLHECLVSQNKSKSIILRIHWTWWWWYLDIIMVEKYMFWRLFCVLVLHTVQAW